MKHVREYEFEYNKFFKKIIPFLIYTNNWGIRFLIARRGYYLDILINDPNRFVRQTAREKQNEIYK